MDWVVDEGLSKGGASYTEKKNDMRKPAMKVQGKSISGRRTASAKVPSWEHAVCICKRERPIYLKAGGRGKAEVKMVGGARSHIGALWTKEENLDCTMFSGKPWVVLN